MTKTKAVMATLNQGRVNCSPHAIPAAAAKAAQIDHFIRTLPEGYQMELNEEVTNISQGQKQLLTIARAILTDPAMLILDEATSSVDTHTELLIREAMDKLMRDVPALSSPIGSLPSATPI